MYLLILSYFSNIHYSNQVINLIENRLLCFIIMVILILMIVKILQIILMKLSCCVLITHYNICIGIIVLFSVFFTYSMYIDLNMALLGYISFLLLVSLHVSTLNSWILPYMKIILISIVYYLVFLSSLVWITEYIFNKNYNSNFYLFFGYLLLMLVMCLFALLYVFMNDININGIFISSLLNVVCIPILSHWEVKEDEMYLLHTLIGNIIVLSIT